MKKFEEILNQYNCPKRINQSSITIEQIEQTVQFKIPEDYKIYLQNYSGFESTIGNEFVRLWDLDELIEANKDYGIFEQLPNTLGIGGNGGGEFIALELLENDYHRIVLSPFIDLDKGYHIEIGTSFSDFLLRLQNGREWFEDTPF